MIDETPEVDLYEDSDLKSEEGMDWERFILGFIGKYDRNYYNEDHMITKLQSGVAKDLLMKGKITMSKRDIDLFIHLFS